MSQTEKGDHGMLRTSFVLVCFIATVVVSAIVINHDVSAQNSTPGAAQQMMKKYTYPGARKGDQLDDYHGVKVADPYRWLEDLDSEETSNWVEAENKLSF